MSEIKADALAKLDNLIAIQSSDGNWDVDPYMHGMANGLIMARSCLTGETPTFLEAPAKWRADEPAAISAETEGD